MRALSQEGVEAADLAAGTGGMTFPGWDPEPGHVDLCVRHAVRPEPRLLAELKIYNIGESLWDLFKLLAASRAETVEAAYLVVAAPEHQWGKDDCAELFPIPDEDERSFDSRTLFRAHAKAWESLLKGGSARLREAPARVSITPVAASNLSLWRDYELRTVAVSAASEEVLAFGAEGWPLEPGRPAT